MKKKVKNGLVWGLVLSITFEAAPVWALSKDETIYANLNSDGSVKSTIVSEHLNDNGKNIISDKTSLKDVTNVNGDEKHSQDGNKIIWEANGNDIYYEGSTEKELPVNMKITYMLDGKEMKVKDMLGKSGKVTIKMKYTNNLKKTVLVNGKNETLYVPFVVTATSILSNDENKNISVTNGKVIDNGSNSVVIALASPGLYESLDIDQLKNLDTIEISYETTDFELASIYSVATNKLLENDDLDVFDNVDKLYESIDTLSKSSTKLVNGSNELLSGINQKIGTKNTLSKAQLDAIGKTAVSAATISQDDVAKKVANLLKDYEISHSDLNKIIKEALGNIKIDDKTKELLVKQIVKSIEGNTSNIQEIIIKASQNVKLTDAQKEAIAKALISKVSISDEQIALISQQATAQALAEVKASTEYKNAVAIKNTYEQNGISQVINLCTNNEVSESNYALCVSQINNIANYKSVVASIKTMEDTTQKVASSVSANVATEINKQIAKQIADSISDEMVSQIATNIANGISKELGTLISNYVTEDNVNKILDSILNCLNDYVENDLNITINQEVLNIVNQKVTEVASEKLTPVANSISQEVASKVSVQVASKVANQVKDSTLTTVSNNLTKLVQGINKFDSEGIQKITNFVNGDVKNIEAKIEALINISNEYQTLDDKDENADGSSKIIYIVEELKQEKKKETEKQVVVEKKSLWSKIKGLFTK